MALATFKPTVIAREAPKDSSVVSEPKKYEVYDHKETPLWSLDAFMSGSPWRVNYFRQRLGKNDTTKKLDINSDPAYQSYEKIERLELLVQTALSPSHRDKEQVMDVTGTAAIYSFLTPNVDDYFVTTSNLARLGLFRITNVNRRTFERESVHVVEYTEEKEITVDDPEYQDLIRKVVVTHVYSKQRLIENRNPLLLKHTFDKVASLQAAYQDLVKNYFNTFFQTSSSTLLVPGQIGRHYDPLLADYICQIVSVLDAPQMQRMHLLSVNNESSYSKDTLWTLLLKRGLENLPYINRNMGKLRPTDIATAYFARSGSFGNADYMVCPINHDVSVGSTACVSNSFQPTPTLPLDYDRTKTYKGIEIDLDTAVYTELSEEVPIYTPVHSASSYIFPESFYNGEKNTLMEILTMDYIQRVPLRLDMLLFMVSYYPQMERLEQFYYGPILMTLLKEADRGAYA